MGCRTGFEEYYDYGNTVRREAPKKRPQIRLSAQSQRRIPWTKDRRIIRQKHRLVVLGTAAAVLIIGISAFMLASLECNRKLSREISSLERQIQELTVVNDARAYEITSSIDLSDVIRTATEELGMVRGSASQTVTFGSRQTEYLQQVAAVPKE